MAKNNVIVTVVGKDRVGIMAEVTVATANLGGNIVDISQKVIAGYFNLIMIVDISKVKIGLVDFKKKLEKLGEKKAYKITVQNEKVFHYMHRI